MNNPSDPHPPDPDEFSKLAEGGSPGTFREFFDFLATNKKWWLTPIIIVLALVGLLIVAGSSASAPFIYTIF